MARDFYSILGVSKGASQDEIKKAYRNLASKFHPDKNAGNPKAEEQFKEIVNAYDTLGDPKKRQAYDQMGRFQSNPGFEDVFYKERAYRPDREGPEGFQDIFGDLFSDIFRSSQHSQNQQRGPSRPRRTAHHHRSQPKGQDLRYTLKISLQEAYHGCEKEIRFVRRQGKHEETAHISVKVPPGVQEGQKLKLRGEGDAVESHPSSPRGDLYILIQLEKDALFQVQGNDIFLEVPLKFEQALTGCEIEVPTLTGWVQLKIPHGASTGKTFRLRGKGLKTPQGLGDMLVRIVIDVPNLEENPSQENLLKQLRDLPQGTLLNSYQKKLEDLKRRRNQGQG